MDRKKENIAIWWIRRDCRLSDNAALQAALAASSQIIPTFILDPRLLSSEYVGERRVTFLFEGLRQLDRELGQRGSSLVVRRGPALEQLQKLVEETGATKIFAQDDYSPYSRRRDRAVAGELQLELVHGLTVHPPDLIHKKDGDPYQVYTPYRRKWLAMPLTGTESDFSLPEEIHTPSGVESLPVPTSPIAPEKLSFLPGEKEAQQRLRNFTSGDEAAIYRYAEDRDRPDLDGTSGLSPYLRFGMISARQAVEAAQSALAAAPGEAARQGAETWLYELVWREFYISILYHFPRVLTSSFREEYDNIVWHNSPEQFAAWQRGETGYPIVDAAMRQLSQTGWMHNRCRMIVASFLVKDLLIDWRWGERHFMQQLLDGDPAANNGGWQWTAGTGTDAAPYFRIFNPVRQSDKFDPSGTYIRRWLPELAGVPDRYIHEPWKMPREVQNKSECRIGREYPSPIVDHSEARESTLEAYKRAREQV